MSLTPEKKSNLNLLLVLLLFLAGVVFFKWMFTNPNCSPCFSYFKYVDHTYNQINVFNGDKGVELVKVSEGTVSIPAAEPGYKITFSSLTLSEGEKFWIEYKLKGDEKVRRDSAVFHFPR